MHANETGSHLIFTTGNHRVMVHEYIPWARWGVQSELPSVVGSSTLWHRTLTDGEISMVRPQPLICVRDVEASSRWYQQVLNCESGHGGPYYERLVFANHLVLQLHHWEVEDHHGRIGDPEDMPPGNGVLLWFEVEDFDSSLERIEKLGAEILLPRHRNPPEGDGGPNHWEIWLRDPDGYKVVLASPDGTADGIWKP